MKIEVSLKTSVEVFRPHSGRPLREAYTSSGRARVALGPPPASRGIPQDNYVP